MTGTYPTSPLGSSNKSKFTQLRKVIWTTQIQLGLRFGQLWPGRR